MKPPIILNENGDMSFFADSTAAGRHTEAIDIKNGEYDVFDADGQVLSIAPNNQGGSISEKKPPEYAPERLREKLLGFLMTTRGSDPAMSVWPLHQLIQYAKKLHEIK